MTTKSKNWMAVRSSLMMASSNFRRMAQPLQMVRANERDYSGTVIAINAKEHLLNVRGWTMRLRSFNLSDHCECRQLAKSQASVDDLRPGEMVTVRYINVEGVRIAIRVEQQPALLAGNIFSLDIQNRSLTLRQKAFNRELQLAEDCEIILHDGLPGRLADLEVGNRVTVTYEAPDNVLTARRIEQTSLKIGGTLTAIDPGVKSFKAKALSGTNKFTVADHCAIVIHGKLDARLADLRPGDKLMVSYDEISGVKVANRISVVEVLLEAVGEDAPAPWFG